jgi:hypothetical protein
MPSHFLTWSRISGSSATPHGHDTFLIRRADKRSSADHKFVALPITVSAMLIPREKVEALVGMVIMMATVTPSNFLRCHLSSRNTEQRLQNRCGNPIARTHQQMGSTDRKRPEARPFRVRVTWCSNLGQRHKNILSLIGKFEAKPITPHHR